jgi:hypothetical protein
VVELWGKSPTGGSVSIYRKRGKRWQRIRRVRTGRGGVFRKRVRVRGRPLLEARAPGGERSLAYRVR